jgi:hypothetical protein
MLSRPPDFTVFVFEGTVIIAHHDLNGAKDGGWYATHLVEGEVRGDHGHLCAIFRAIGEVAPLTPDRLSLYDTASWE